MRLHIDVPLRWSDFDAYAHVNNAEMFHLLEEARIQAFWRPDSGSADSSAMAVLDSRPGAAHMSVIARQEIEYLLPIPYQRQPIDVELWIGRLGNASLEVCYKVFSPSGVEPRQLYAKAATTLVLVEVATEKPARITDQQRVAWAPYVEAPVEFTQRR